MEARVIMISLAAHVKKNGQAEEMLNGSAGKNGRRVLQGKLVACLCRDFCKNFGLVKGAPASCVMNTGIFPLNKVCHSFSQKGKDNEVIRKLNEQHSGVHTEARLRRDLEKVTANNSKHTKRSKR